MHRLLRLSTCAVVTAVWLVTLPASTQMAIAAGACPLTDANETSLGDLAYKSRGKFCEGLLEQQISASSNLRIIGLHGANFLFTNGGDGTIHVRVPVTAGAASATKTQLRILSTRPQLNYRLDTPMPNGRFDWERTIVDNPDVVLQAGELAALACVGGCGGQQPKLLPVSIYDVKAPKATAVPRQLTLLLKAGLDLAEAYVEVTQASDGQVVMNEKVLSDVLVAGDVLPVNMETAQWTVSDTYRVRVVAKAVQSASTDQVKAEILLR
jgi:hypothetical protein